MGHIFNSDLLITMPYYGAMPVFTGLLYLYSITFLFGFGMGYVLSFMKRMFSLVFERD
ncbi:hypothetical protein KQ086_000698 [Salmonella enterica]|nr:hypothetical protein [Salmonella enterica]